MPELNINLDATSSPLRALEELYRRYPLLQTAEALVKAGHLIHLPGAPLEIGVMPRGMASGEPAVMISVRLPNRKVVLAETSYRLFLTAADQIKSRWGDPRMADLGMPDLILPPDFPALAIIRAARLSVENALDNVSGDAQDELRAIHERLIAVEQLDGIPDAPPEWQEPGA